MPEDVRKLEKEAAAKYNMGGKDKDEQCMLQLKRV